MDWTNAKRQGVNDISRGLTVGYPGQIFQRGHFLTWPHARKWQMINDLNIDVIVNLWVKTDSDLSGISYLNFPMPGDEVPHWSQPVVALLEGMVNANLLIHCEAGVNRSAWLCARILMARYEMTGEQAYGRVMIAHPKARIHSTLKYDLLREA